MRTSITPTEVQSLNEQFRTSAPEEVLVWGLQRFGQKVALASSFGAEDVVLIDMLSRLDPAARVFTLDTLRLHTETYDVIDRLRQRYKLDIETYHPDLQAVDEMVRVNGYNLFYRGMANRKLCCGIRKVEPLQRALGGLDAWITGLRRDQADTRTETDKVEIDEVHDSMIKLNPLADWSSEEVWAYIHEHNVPYNTLHDHGFPSIGCAPCTRAIAPGEDPRAGRWWWEQDPSGKECGIHIGAGPEPEPLPLFLNPAPPSQGAT